MTPTESKPTVVLVALLAATVLLASPALAVQLDSTETNDTFEIDLEEGDDGDTVTVLLKSSLSDVAGLDAEIAFNEDVVRLVDTEGVDLGETALAVNDDHNEGTLKLTQAVAPSDAVDEPVMTALTFEVIGEGDIWFEVNDAETAVYEMVDGEPVGNNIQTMSLDMSTDELSQTGGETGDEDSSDAGTETDGTSGDSDGEATDGSGEQSAGSDGDAGDGSSETSTGDEHAGEGDEETDSGETDDESGETSTTSGDSELISGIGLFAVVAGFLFAVAILARDQM